MKERKRFIKREKHPISNYRSLRGFTLVELSTIIVVISIMVTLSGYAYSQVQTKSRDNKRDTDTTVLVTALEKFYETNGEYPPGCPEDTCTAPILTANSSTAAFTATTTLSTLTGTLPSLGPKFGDPSIPSDTTPLMSRNGTTKEYYYYGGTVNYTGSTLTNTYSNTAVFPCSITSNLNAGQVGSYVVGYFSAATSKWVLKGGRSGVSMTILAGSASDGCVINKA